VMSQPSQGPKSPASPSTISSYYGSPAVPALLSPQNQITRGQRGCATSGRSAVSRFGRVFRFDVTKEMGLQQCGHENRLGLADPELYGVRVAASVTGTGLSDLAGSLTYSFNRRKPGSAHFVFGSDRRHDAAYPVSDNDVQA